MTKTILKLLNRLCAWSELVNLFRCSKSFTELDDQNKEAIHCDILNVINLGLLLKVCLTDLRTRVEMLRFKKKHFLYIFAIFRGNSKVNDTSTIFINSFS